jgi:hypothetical protein
MALIIITPTTTAPGTSTATGASTTAATAARTSTTAAARRAAAIGLRSGFINVQRAPTEFFAIERGNCFFRFRGIGHFDEGKAARTASIAIGYDADLLDGPVRLEQRPQLCFGGAVGDVADKQLLHDVSSVLQAKV